MKSYSEMAKEVRKKRDQYDQKRKKYKKAAKLFSLVLAFMIFVGVLLFWNMGDENTEVVKAVDLMVGIQRNPVSGTENLMEDSRILSDFAVRLLQTEMKKGENVLLSPLSVVEALGMTINGADSSTLGEMEAVLGLDADELNRFCYSYHEALPKVGTSYLIRANSIWFSANGTNQVINDFLQRDADYYDAEMFQVPFDSHLADQMNEWVSEKTKGTIPKVLDKTSKEAVLYLINALSFEAEWGKKFPITNVKDGDFLLGDGRKIKVTYLTDMEFRYLENDRATGFMKSYAPYSGRRYYFVALLPREGISVEEYVAGLSGDELHSMIQGMRDTAVLAQIPKFDVTYDGELSGSLKGMGMTKAFDQKEADFSRMVVANTENEQGRKKAADNVYLSKVIHKTMLSLNERGTKAGAVTAVEMELGGTTPDYEEVSLMRPFVYAIIDDQASFPIFLGICQVPQTGDASK